MTPYDPDNEFASMPTAEIYELIELMELEIESWKSRYQSERIDEARAEIAHRKAK